MLGDYMKFDENGAQRKTASAWKGDSHALNTPVMKTYRLLDTLFGEDIHCKYTSAKGYDNGQYEAIVCLYGKQTGQPNAEVGYKPAPRTAIYPLYIYIYIYIYRPAQVVYTCISNCPYLMCCVARCCGVAVVPG
jgi:hypothetical protein